MHAIAINLRVKRCLKSVRGFVVHNSADAFNDRFHAHFLFRDLQTITLRTDVCYTRTDLYCMANKDRPSWPALRPGSASLKHNFPTSSLLSPPFEICPRPQRSLSWLCLSTSAIKFFYRVCMPVVSRTSDPESSSLRMEYAACVAPRNKDMLISFSHSTPNSSVEMSLRRSTTYEHRLKDLEVHNLTASVTHHALSWRPSLTISTGQAPRRPQQLSGAGRHHPQLFHLHQGTPLAAAGLTFPFPFPFPPAIADPHRRPFRFSLSAEIPQSRPGHATHERPTDRRRARGIAARPQRLAELEARLPATRTQASQVQRVYDSGPRKVRAASYCKTRKKNACAFLITLLVVAM